MHMLYIWLAVLCVGLLIEWINAGTLISVWFSVGAIIPLIMSFWGITTPLYITLQVVIFGLVSILCLVFLRKIAKKLLFKNTQEKTNLELYVGKKMKIVAEYNKVPYIKFNGIEYKAIAEDGVDLNIDDEVEIVRFEGNKAIVKKV
ncbi:MAG: NfeD family protein [Clostridiales bacterium]|nr:NfeD family protein [Clostridiales bacterium]